MSGESSRRLTAGFRPSVGQDDWSEELSSCVYTNMEGTTESDTSWFAQAERGHFQSSLCTSWPNWLVPFCLQKLKC